MRARAQKGMSDVRTSLGEDGRSAAPAGDRVALVLCTRDRPEFLAGALDALQRVLPETVEVIVVDSGSVTDATRRVADRDGIRYVRSDIPGLSIARNAGLAATTREIVVFTDDDCELQPDAIERLTAPFAASTVGAVAGRLRDHSDTSDAEPPPARVLSDTRDGLAAGHGALMAFRTALLRQLGGFDPVLGAGRDFGGAEDLDAFCRVLHSGSTVVQAPDAVVRHLFTRSDDDYIRLNSAYGRGIGAMARKWVAATGGEGRALTRLALRRAAVRLARRLGDSRARHGQWAYLRGFQDGYRRAGHLSVDGLVFRDQNPPAAVDLASSAPDTVTERGTA